MPIIHFEIGDKIQLKKKHPCSFDIFKIQKCGTDVKIICTGCSREMMLPREKLEKMIKKVIPKEI